MFLASEFAGSGDCLNDLIDLRKGYSLAYIENAADLDEDKSWMQANMRMG